MLRGKLECLGTRTPQNDVRKPINAVNCVSILLFLAYFFFLFQKRISKPHMSETNTSTLQHDDAGMDELYTRLDGVRT